MDEYRLPRRRGGPLALAFLSLLILSMGGLIVATEGWSAVGVALMVAPVPVVLWCVAQIVFPPPRLTADGVLLRRAFARRPFLLPWGKVMHVSAAPDGRPLHLSVIARDRVSRPYHLQVGADVFRWRAVGEALARLSGGRFTLDGQVEESPADPDGPAPRALRPAPWTYAVAALLAVAGAALLFLGDTTPRWSVVQQLGGYLVALGGAGLWVARGRSTVDRRGVRTAAGHLPWDAVDAVEERHLGPWRRVRLVLPGGRGVPVPGLVTLTGSDRRFRADVAALQELSGERVEHRDRRASELVAAAVVLVLALGLALYRDRPWDRAFWPGVAIATTTPDPCAANAAEARRLLPAAPTATRRDEPTAGGVEAFRCHWREEDTLRYLIVVVERCDLDADHDAVQAAAAQYERQVRIYASRGTETAGIADAATITVRSGTARAVARRANVVIRVEYEGGKQTPEEARTVLVGIIRTTAAAVRLD
ncbi:hypothetical protein Val02_73480 [Virgisporangium aliadipatigenens]|uniref:PH domain-containing protein n=1 Tax=Virgisporangium aliadipatigenens TaxID=741659 RepID=A0A8J3YTQ2_9ACTN|nr:hypothetical protein [Virgisporangium aliadipatigenens]GIJ50462.1 hypothetical protein Val02_73480 [Virgisporangium aliadipatigenens]